MAVGVPDPTAFLFLTGIGPDRIKEENKMPTNKHSNDTIGKQSISYLKEEINSDSIWFLRRQIRGV
jgi:hypothetical protein